MKDEIYSVASVIRTGLRQQKRKKETPKKLEMLYTNFSFLH
jgi:hypothetical protein